MTLEQRERRILLVESLENLINESYNHMNINVELEVYYNDDREYISLNIMENHNAIVLSVEVTDTSDLQLIKYIVSRLSSILE